MATIEEKPTMAANTSSEDASEPVSMASVEGDEEKDEALKTAPSSAPDNSDQKVDPNAMEVAAAPQQPAKQKSKVVLTMIAICLAVFLAALDVTIVSTALPTIAADFKASESDYTWIGSSYMLAAAATTPSWGKISDIFGRKPVLLTANVIFVIGSLVSALSININMLIGGRVLQGVGAGGLLTLPTVCIADMFSVRDRGLYFSLIGLTWSLAGSIGPVIGGAFSTYVSWRWNFWINLPIDGLAFILLIFFLDIHNPRTPLIAGIRAIDWIGTLLVVGGTCMFLLGMNFGGVTYSWDSAAVICLIIFGIMMLMAFAIYEWKVAQYPLMPPRLFKSRSNVAALAMPLLHGFVFISDSYFLPQYFQVVLGASPILSGAYLLPFIIPLCFLSAGTGIYIKATGKYLPPIYIGMFLLTLGHGLYIDLKPYISWPRVIIFQIIVGCGAGPIFQAPLIALHSGIEPRDMAAATSMFNFARNIGTAISVVVGGSIFSNQISTHRNELAAVLPPGLVDQLSGGGVAGARDIVNALPDAQQTVVRTVYAESLRTLWIFYTCIAVLGLGVSFLIKKTVLSTIHKEHKTGLVTEQQLKEKDLELRKAEKGDIENAA